MTDLIDTVQLQEIDAGIVELFDFTLPSGTSVYLFKGLEGGENSVWFPNKQGTALNEYIAIPLELTGISFSSSGASNRPSLSIANIPSLSRALTEDETTLDDVKRSENILSEEGIYNNEDLLGTQLVYRTTLTSHLKAEADIPSLPIEFPSQKFILDRVSSENNIFVEFELANPFDLEGVTLPSRQVIGRYCPWEYQGHKLGGRGGCNWPLDSKNTFFNKENESIPSPSTYDDEPKNSGDIVKTIDEVQDIDTSELTNYTRIWQAVRDVPANKDPRTHGIYWKRLDVCGKLVQSCKVRFQSYVGGFEPFTGQALPDYNPSTEYSFEDQVTFNNVVYEYINSTSSVGNDPHNSEYWQILLNTAVSLPFGGFPGTKKYK